MEGLSEREREIWIVTDGLNGGLVTYPSLAGFTYTHYFYTLAYKSVKNKEF